jgi:cell division ATPase FtsA
LYEKKREGYGLLLDIGYMSSSISVVYGNGIVHEESFDFGVASVLVALMKTLDIEFPVAEEMLELANISGGSVPKDLAYFTELDERTFSVQKINDIIKCSLDELCERMDAFLKKYYQDKAAVLTATNRISITGEGVSGIKGAAEHVEKRVSWRTETVSPDLPYYDKPTCSSRIALLSMAISDGKKKSLWERIFHKNGGKRK